jgi:type IVB pilus formation R64 PilN family outer membrane protein
MKKNMRLTSIAAACTLALLSGCSSLPAVKDSSAKFDAASAAAERAEAPRAAPVIEYVKGTPWLLGREVAAEKPALPELKAELTLKAQTPMALTDVAAFITRQTGIPVQIGEDALKSNPVTVDYSGKLSGLLTQVCGTSLYWKTTKDGSIRIFARESRTFEIPALFWKSNTRTELSSNSSMSNSSAGASTGSGSGSTGSQGSGAVTVQTTSLGDQWASLKDMVKALAGKDADVVVDPVNSLLVVTGTPPELDRVGDFVKVLTDGLNRQVAVSIDMYSVQVSREDNLGFNPTVAFNSLGQRYGFSLTGIAAPTISGGQAPLSFGASVLTPTPAPTQGFYGTSGLVQALSTLGKTSLVLSQSTITLNGQVAPLQSVLQTGYLASSSTQASVTAGIAPTTTLNPGTVTTGFTAMLLPKIVNGGIYLGMNFTLSRLLGLNPVLSNGSMIQTPSVSLSATQQSVKLLPGQSLMLTALQQDSSNAQNTGVGSPNFALLGGGTDGQSGKQMLVIVVTAKLI